MGTLIYSIKRPKFNTKDKPFVLSVTAFERLFPLNAGNGVYLPKQDSYILTASIIETGRETAVAVTFLITSLHRRKDYKL